MAAITDLTWQELQAAVGVTGAITVVSGAVVIDVGKISGDTVDALTDGGVVKFANKFLDACTEAQATANTNQVAGEKLNAFNSPTFSAPSSGKVLATRTTRTNYELESATLLSGPNV